MQNKVPPISFGSNILYYIYMKDLPISRNHISDVILCADDTSVLVLHTPWSRVLLEKLTAFQPVKKFPTFHGPQRFIIAFTSACHLSLSWASLIQYIPPHPTSWRSILILSSNLCLGLPSGLFPSGFPTKTLYAPLLPYTCYIPRPSHSLFDRPNDIWWWVQSIKLLVT